MSEFIKSKAAIAWGPNQPLSVEEVDVMMPKMDGFDVLKKLRSSHSTPGMDDGKGTKLPGNRPLRSESSQKSRKPVSPNTL